MKKYVPGVYEDIPFDEYLQIPYLSKSLVSAVLKSPAHARALLENPKKSQALELGSYIDDLLLGDISKYVPEPEFYFDDKGNKKPFTLKSSKCREMKARWELEGKGMVKKDYIEIGEAIKKNISNNATASQLLTGKKQVTIIWDEPTTGCRLKGRIDVLGDGFITDLKTTRDASTDAFRRSMLLFGYHIQAAMYVDGYEFLTGDLLPFNFVAVETEPPFGIKSYSIREDSLMLGRMKYRKAAEIWKQCEESGNWPGYEEGIELIDVPPYALKPLYDGEEEPLYV
jgi:hypothetical protein